MSNWDYDPEPQFPLPPSTMATLARLYDQRRWFSPSDAQTTVAVQNIARHRNLSGPTTSTTVGVRPTGLDNRSLATPPPGVPGVRDTHLKGENLSGNNGRSPTASATSPTSTTSTAATNGSSSHRKLLDRSHSDSEDRINGNQRGVNSSRYKTELCRPYEENGHCKYGEKCQFAHGASELRNLTRHPKYKTELCRTFHSNGFCPYGPRCHFIHNEEEHFVEVQQQQHKNCAPSPPSTRLSQQQQRQLPMVVNSAPTPKPRNLCGLNSIGSSFESVSASSSPGNLSPSHQIEELFNSTLKFSNNHPTIPRTNRESEILSSNTNSNTIFNFPASDATGAGSVLTPLNVQTQQMYNNLVDVQGMNAFLNMTLENNFNNRLGGAGASRLTSTLAATLKEIRESSIAGEQLRYSPVSSDESMGSNGSLNGNTNNNASNGSYGAYINSPLDVGRSMRLPIFSNISSETSDL